GRAPGATTAGASGRCAAAPPFDPTRGPHWTGWSGDVTNTRFQPAADAGVSAEQTPKLTLKWAVGFPNAVTARAAPTLAGGRGFVGSQSGTVYAIDAKSGCIVWTFQAKAGVRTGIVIGPRGAAGSSGSGASGGYAAYFGDARANAYGIDAATGEQLWTRTLD